MQVKGLSGDGAADNVGCAVLDKHGITSTSLVFCDSGYLSTGYGDCAADDTHARTITAIEQITHTGDAAAGNAHHGAITNDKYTAFTRNIVSRQGNCTAGSIYTAALGFDVVVGNVGFTAGKVYCCVTVKIAVGNRQLTAFCLYTIVIGNGSGSDRTVGNGKFTSFHNHTVTERLAVNVDRNTRNDDLCAIDTHSGAHKVIGYGTLG